MGIAPGQLRRSDCLHEDYAVGPLVVQATGSIVRTPLRNVHGTGRPHQNPILLLTLRLLAFWTTIGITFT